MPIRLSTPIRTLAVLGILLALLVSSRHVVGAFPEGRVTLAGRHVPAAVANAQALKRVEPNRPIRLTFVLPLQDPQGRSDLIKSLYDPHDPQYRHFLTPREFASRFAPSLESVHEIAEYAASQGLSIHEVSANRTVIVMQGEASSVEKAFQVHLHDYIADDGTRFRAPDCEPTLPGEIASQLLTIEGFDDLPAASPNSRRVLPSFSSLGGLPGNSDPNSVPGTGPGGYFAPIDVQSIYSLSSVPATGAGQTLGLFELDGYTSSDIAEYETEFYAGRRAVTLQNILLDGYDGKAQTSGGAAEVTLDIDMMIALAPDATKIIVYEADNTTSGLLAAYNRIASDDVATVASSSWGLTETAASYYGQIAPESQIFEQMAAQGQTMFVASGDAGAYADGWTLSVQDPASQPTVTAVGGTYISPYYPAPLQYGYEAAWGAAYDISQLRPHGQGGGGGVSVFHLLPSYQRGTASTGSFVSTTMRNVPDVSLFGDYDSGGYAIYFTDPANSSAGGRWMGYGGTSAASPLWAGFAALVNQGRAEAGRVAIGFFNPPLYRIGENSTSYARDFHDIKNGTNNLYYPCVSGYDLATGWGSFIGSGLYADLISSLTMPTVSSFAPVSGSIGIPVLLHGTGFTGATSVTFGGASANFTVNSDTALSATVPPNAKTGPIMVTNAVGIGQSLTSFVIASGGAPTITSITPSNAPAGTVIAILGSGFTGATSVSVGGVAVAFTIVNDGKITITVPAGLGGGAVAITTPMGTTVSTTRVSTPTWAAIDVSAAPDGTARLLWVRNDSAAGIWSLDAANRTLSVGPTYGPYASNGSVWNAFSIAAAPDGSSRVLWTRGDGAAGVWTINASGIETQVGPTYGPYSDPSGHWAASGIAVAPDGSIRMLWDRSDGAMGLWTMNSSGSMTRVGPTYGPYPDGQGSHWTALGISSVPDDTSRVLWMRGDGAMGLWNFDSGNRPTLVGPVYGPYIDSGGDWYPLSLSVSTDNLSHVLWGRSDGAAGAWSLNASGVETSIGPIYGPYPEFSPFNLSISGEQSRLLWVETDRAAGLWTLDGGKVKTIIGPTYGPF